MKRISIFFGLLSMASTMSSIAFACSIEIPPLRKDFRRANSVFIGEVLSVQEAKLSPEAKAYFPKAWQSWDIFSTIRFKVNEQWKGSNSTEKEFVGVAYFDCGCPDAKLDEFKPGSQFLVFANHKKFLTVCESEKVGSEYVQNRIERLDSFWFRTWATVYPF